MMGLLRELMDRQETYRGILQQLEQQDDKSFVEAASMGTGMDTEAVVSVAVVLFEIEAEREPDRMPRSNDLIWAIEFIDHLDTLGKVVVSK